LLLKLLHAVGVLGYELVGLELLFEVVFYVLLVVLRDLHYLVAIDLHGFAELFLLGTAASEVALLLHGSVLLQLLEEVFVGASP